MNAIVIRERASRGVRGIDLKTLASLRFFAPLRETGVAKMQKTAKTLRRFSERRSQQKHCVCRGSSTTPQDQNLGIDPTPPRRALSESSKPAADNRLLRFHT